MTKIKVGDRVMYNGSFITTTHINLRGRQGVVKEVDDGYSVEYYTVDYDDDVGGQGYEKLNIKNGHGFVSSGEELELVSKLGVYSKRVE